MTSSWILHLELKEQWQLLFLLLPTFLSNLFYQHFDLLARFGDGSVRRRVAEFVLENIVQHHWSAN